MYIKMNYIMLILSVIIIPIMSLNKVKLCINCKYFLPDNDNNIYGKCTLFPLNQGRINYLVSGVNKDEYFYCTTARSQTSMCGGKGVKYKKKRVVKEEDISK